MAASEYTPLRVTASSVIRVNSSSYVEDTKRLFAKLTIALHLHRLHRVISPYLAAQGTVSRYGVFYLLLQDV